MQTITKETDGLKAIYHIEKDEYTTLSKELYINQYIKEDFEKWIGGNVDEMA